MQKGGQTVSKKKGVSFMIFYKCLMFFFSFCGGNIPDDTILTGKSARKGLRVHFVSDKENVGSGAQCVARCLDEDTTTQTSNGTVPPSG